MMKLQPGDLILGDNQYYSMDGRVTQLNNNVLIVGTSGSGKSRSIVGPNLLQASGSYIISDPKGALYGQYAEYLREKGYVVRKLDFENPKDSAHYNPFLYIRNEGDILRLAHNFVFCCNDENAHVDPFWDDADELLFVALIAYLHFHLPPSERTLSNLTRLLHMCQVDDDNINEKTALDCLMERSVTPGNDYAFRQYQKFRIGAARTLRSILITASSKLGKYDFPDLNYMLSDDNLNLHNIGSQPTALFVIVNDTDRSMDRLANIFYSQAMSELCYMADYESPNNRLEVPVRFILDDFASGCKLDDFPKIIATIRSRNISAMLMIQAESQLSAIYGEDGRTIIGNCDSYVYLGGNDITTAESVAKRCNKPLHQILNMSVGTNWIFRRGQAPVNGVNFPLEEYHNRTKTSVLSRE